MSTLRKNFYNIYSIILQFKYKNCLLFIKYRFLLLIYERRVFENSCNYLICFTTDHKYSLLGLDLSMQGAHDGRNGIFFVQNRRFRQGRKISRSFFFKLKLR